MSSESRLPGPSRGPAQCRSNACGHCCDATPALATCIHSGFTHTTRAQVREDLGDVLQRVGAGWDEEREEPLVKFRGWARMAMPLAGFDIIEVKPPKVRCRRCKSGISVVRKQRAC